MPRLPLLLSGADNHVMEVRGLVDSGATVSVLPFSIGQQLGGKWSESDAKFQLGGKLSRVASIPLILTAQVGLFHPVRLGFAWTQSDTVPIILGLNNFFQQFDVFFYRSELEFEIKPRK